MMDRVVITGYGVISALGKNINEFSCALFSGETGITEKIFSFKDGEIIGNVGEIELDTAVSFFEENNLPYDRCSHLALIAADECFKSSEINLDKEDSYRIGTIIGTSLGGMLSGEKFLTQWIETGFETADENLLKQYPLHALPDLIARRFNLNGIRSVISTACSAGANSIGFGSDLIKSGKCDIVLAGGVDPLARFSLAGFNSLKALDNYPCKPYSKSEGINLGEGAAFVVLEGYNHALLRGAKILAEFSGYGISADAYHHTAPDLGGAGAARAMKMAMADSGIEAKDISYVNGHGTGTTANDSAETRAFINTFKENIDKIPLSSTKGATAHCLGAAGAIEAVVSILAIEKDIIPPTINFQKPLVDKINYVPNYSQRKTCKNVLSNSFAFGGNNCSIVISKPDNKNNNNKNKNLSSVEDSIVITGIGCVGTGGNNVAEFWHTLDKGINCIDDIKSFDTVETKCKWMGKEPNVVWPKYIAPKFLRRIDEITRLAMVASREALQDSKLKVTTSNCDRIGVVYATGTGPLGTIYEISRDIVSKGAEAVSPYQFPNSVINAAAGNISIANMLKGPTSTITSGGTSLIVAIEYAIQLLQSRKADAILVVGADECNQPLIMGNDKMGLLSTNRAMPLTRNASGMILSSGSTAFVLETKNHAENRNANIYSVVKNCEIIAGTTELSSFCKTDNVLRDCIALNLTKCGLHSVDYYLSSANGNSQIDSAERHIIEEYFDEGVTIGVLASLIGTTVGTYSGYGMLSAIRGFSQCKLHAVPRMIYDEFEDTYLVKSIDKNISNACISATSFGGACASIVLEKYNNEK